MANAPSAFDSHTYLNTRQTIPLTVTFIQELEGKKNSIKCHIDSKGLLFVLVVFANDFNVVSNKIYRVETNSKLPNEIEISTCLHFLHERWKKKEQPKST